MSVRVWARRYRDRTIAPQERAAATLAVAVLVSVCVAGLILTRPAPPATRDGERGFPRTQAQQRQPAIGVLSPSVTRAVDGFLVGYLAYIYGHGRACQIKDATVSLARSLQAHPPRVPQGLDGLKPKVLRLLATPAPGGGPVGVTAIISDEEVVTYRIPLALTPSRGRFLVSGLDAG
jgi:hypothetical protein